jgi:hypothetical protein
MPGLLEPGRPANYLRYALLGQRRIDGWLEDLGLTAIDRIDGIQRAAGVHGGVAEIGVHHGRLFILLALLRRTGESAVAIDLFEDQHLNVDSSGRGDRAVLEKNLGQWDPTATQVRIEKADSTTVTGATLTDWAGGPLRLVSVDGGHTAELTKHDLSTACDALAPGGVVILDDCFNQFFPAVGEGAQDFFRSRGDVEPFFAGGNKTLICHTDRAEHYRMELVSRLEGYPMHVEERTFLGRTIAAAESLAPRYNRLYWRRYFLGRFRRPRGSHLFGKAQ